MLAQMLLLTPRGLVMGSSFFAPGLEFSVLVSWTGCDLANSLCILTTLPNPATAVAAMQALCTRCCCRLGFCGKQRVNAYPFCFLHVHVSHFLQVWPKETFEGDMGCIHKGNPEGIRSKSPCPTFLSWYTNSSVTMLWEHNDCATYLYVIW